jgi:hypothetical protein
LCEEYDSTIFLPTNTTNITTNNLDYIYDRWKQNIVKNRLFKKEKKRMKSWMTDSTLLIIEEKRRLASRRDTSLEDRENYRIICRRVKKAVAKDKHAHMLSMIDELNTCMKRSNLHGVFSIIKKKIVCTRKGY